VQAARHRSRANDRADARGARGSRREEGERRSGIRMDLARESPEYLEELARTTSAGT
jgi:hypothetical protein